MREKIVYLFQINNKGSGVATKMPDNTRIQEMWIENVKETDITIDQTN